MRALEALHLNQCDEDEVELKNLDAQLIDLGHEDEEEK